jgi:hypothetical protein
MGIKLHLSASTPAKSIFVFFCPACKYMHPVHVPDWHWDHSMTHPTFSPSLLVPSPIRCHSFIRNGSIQYLGDCEHALKNQIVEIPDWVEGTAARFRPEDEGKEVVNV